MFNEVSLNLLLGHVRIVLSGDEDRIDSLNLVTVVLHGHLSFAVRSEICESAVLSHVCKSLCQLVSKRNRHRHKLRRFVAGKAEHDALVSRADSVDSVV